MLKRRERQKRVCRCLHLPVKSRGPLAIGIRIRHRRCREFWGVGRRQSPRSVVVWTCVGKVVAAPRRTARAGGVVTSERNDNLVKKKID